jgi:hypothetical protein
MSPSDDIRYLGERIDSLREAVSETARGVHDHLDKQTATIAAALPHDQAWWITPLKICIYVCLTTGVLALAGAGFIELEFVQELLRSWVEKLN